MASQTVDRKPDVDLLELPAKVMKTELDNGGWKRDVGGGMPVNTAPPPPLPSVQIIDTEVLYRR